MVSIRCDLILSDQGQNCECPWSPTSAEDPARNASLYKLTYSLTHL